MSEQMRHIHKREKTTEWRTKLVKETWFMPEHRGMKAIAIRFLKSDQIRIYVNSHCIAVLHGWNCKKGADEKIWIRKGNDAI